MSTKQEYPYDVILHILADDKQIYVFNKAVFVTGTEPDEIFAHLGANEGEHALYL